MAGDGFPSRELLVDASKAKLGGYLDELEQLVRGLRQVDEPGYDDSLYVATIAIRLAAEKANLDALRERPAEPERRAA